MFIYSSYCVVLSVSFLLLRVLVCMLYFTYQMCCLCFIPPIALFCLFHSYYRCYFACFIPPILYYRSARKAGREGRQWSPRDCRTPGAQRSEGGDRKTRETSKYKCHIKDNTLPIIININHYWAREA